MQLCNFYNFGDRSFLHMGDNVHVQIKGPTLHVWELINIQRTNHIWYKEPQAACTEDRSVRMGTHVQFAYTQRRSMYGGIPCGYTVYAERAIYTLKHVHWDNPMWTSGNCYNESELNMYNKEMLLFIMHNESTCVRNNNRHL